MMCTDLLEFLSVYNISKSKYFPIFIEAHNMLRWFENFVHFDILEMIQINNPLKNELEAEVFKKLAIITEKNL